MYPTETCYGIGCDATNAQAVEKIFTIKGREKTKSVLMLASSIDMVKHYAVWSDAAETLARRYWPDALTMVLPYRHDAGLPSLLIGSDQTVAFRVSSHPFVNDLLHTLQVPLVSTSANVSGRPSPYDSREVLVMFESVEAQPDIVIDAGKLPLRPPSTIVRVGDTGIHILRQGDISIKI